MWSGRNGVIEKAVVGWRSMAGKGSMMFVMEGAENLISYLMMVWGMGRFVVFVVRGMVKSVMFVVWGMVRWAVLEFAVAFVVWEMVRPVVFVLSSVVAMVVVFVFVAMWRGWG